METLIAQNPGAVATLIGVLCLAVVALAGFLFRDLWSRVAKAPYVTKEEMEKTVAIAFGSLAKDIEQLSGAIGQATKRLARGDGCFDDFERAFRVILLLLHRMCRAWENRFKERMDCEELSRLMRDIHAS